MGTYLAYCRSKSQQVALNIKNECKSSHESQVSKTTFHTINDFGHENFHVHQGDFITQKPSEFLVDYDLQEEIGSGSFGRVKRSFDKRTLQPRAIKCVLKSDVSNKDTGKLMGEVNLLSHLDHPNIVKIYEVLEDERYYYIVSELLTGGELLERLSQNKHFTEQEAAKIMWQVLASVAYCHRFDVVHKDLKPENILFDSMFDDTIKIIDFGLAQAFQPEERMHGVSGTAYYMAPEVLKGDYTEKCDVWSCGVILYVMLCGVVPFKGHSCQQIYENIIKGSFEFKDPVWNTISNSAKKLIKKMLKYNPEKRISAQKALKSPWFKKYLKKTPANKSIAEEALKRLSNFKVTSKLQEAFWVFLVSFFSSKSDVHRLAETFRAIDKDNDGQLARDELESAYMKILNMSPAAARDEAEKILVSLDANNDGKVDYSEFISATIARNMLLTKDKLEIAFRMIDKNCDGKITAEELKKLFNDERIQKLSYDVWMRWLQQADIPNGELTIEKFKEMMLVLYES